MASSLRTHSQLQRLLPRSAPRLRPAPHGAALRFYSDGGGSGSGDVPPPALPTLQILRADLKTAMRSRDANRLSVLRSLLAAVTDASKTPTPVSTDAQLLRLMRKKRLAVEEAAAEFRQSGREDLAEKEEAQGRIFGEYERSIGVETVTGEKLGEAAALARQQVEQLGAKVDIRGVMERATSLLEGKDVDKKELVEAVKKAISA